jgi:hypothetical protein
LDLLLQDKLSHFFFVISFVLVPLFIAILSTLTTHLDAFNVHSEYRMSLQESARISSEMEHIRVRISELGRVGSSIRDPAERRKYRQQMRSEYDRLQIRFKELRSQLYHAEPSHYDKLLKVAATQNEKAAEALRSSKVQLEAAQRAKDRRAVDHHSRAAIDFQRAARGREIAAANATVAAARIRGRSPATAQIPPKQETTKLMGLHNNRASPVAVLADDAIKNLASSLYKIVTKKQRGVAQEEPIKENERPDTRHDSMKQAKTIVKTEKIDEKPEIDELTWFVPNRIKTPEPKSALEKTSFLDGTAAPVPTRPLQRKMAERPPSSDDDSGDVPVWAASSKKKEHAKTLEQPIIETKKGEQHTSIPISMQVAAPATITPPMQKKIQKRVVTFKNVTPVAASFSETETEGEPSVRNLALLAGLQRLK